MPATPTGILSVMAAKLRRMVAESATFIAAVGAANADAAEQDVHLKNVIGKVPRPFAIVSMGDALDWTVISGGDAYDMRPTSGSLYLYLTRDTNPAYLEDRVSAEYDAWNFFSGVVAEVAALSCADDADSAFSESHLPITRITVENWGETDSEVWNSLGRFYFAAFRVQWGDE